MMSTLRRTAAVFAVSSAVAEACPGSPSAVHASAQVTTTFPGSTCDAIRTEMKARINGEGGWKDPHNGGTYSVLTEDGDKLVVQRVTGNNKYTDKMDFTFLSEERGCELKGCSESQVFSIADSSTNFCNMHNLYCNREDGCPIVKSDFPSYNEDVSASFGASHDKHACIATSSADTFLGVVAEATCPPPGFNTQGALQGGFDLDWYVNGKWHIQQQMVLSYLPKEYTYCVTAQYMRLDKPSLLGYNIQVDNYAENKDGKVQGPIRQICSKVVNEKEGKLEVAPCFIPPALSGDYWVVAFDKEEDWALVSGGPPKNEGPDGKSCRTGTGVNGSGLWIFTRKQERDEVLIQKVRGIATAKGFDVSVLVDIDQTNCKESAADSQVELSV